MIKLILVSLSLIALQLTHALNINMKVNETLLNSSTVANNKNTTIRNRRQQSSIIFYFY